jgi:serine protease Do
MSKKTLFPYILFLIFCISCSRNSSSSSDKADARTNPVGPITYTKFSTPGQSDSLVSQSRGNAITRAVQRVSPAVVSITVTEQVKRRQQDFGRFFDHFFPANPSQRAYQYKSMGSGFIINRKGFVVTNQHVVSDNAKKIVVALTDGSRYDAKVIGTDKLDDLSLLKIKADTTFPFVRFGDSDNIMVGEWSLALGNPFGLFKASQPSVTVGVVSALNRDFRPNPDKPRVYLNMIQTDAAINSGNSGGPLVDSQGKVIGVNTFIYTGGMSNGFVGLGFAIPSNRVKRIVKELEEYGKVRKGYDLGMKTRPMTYRLAAQNRLPAIVGLLVSSVNRDGPAFKSGIIPGDIIVKIDHQRVQSPMHAKAIMREHSVGDTMQIQLIRNDKLYKTEIKLRPRVSEK